MDEIMERLDVAPTDLKLGYSELMAAATPPPRLLSSDPSLGPYVDSKRDPFPYVTPPY